MKKIALHSLGCKVNSYETDAMRQILEERGYEIVPFDEGADVYIINTCTVTNIADRKSRQMIHRAKKMNKDAVVVAAGCYVQAAGEDVKADDAIDIIIGNNNKHSIADILEMYFESKDNNTFLSELNTGCGYDEMKMTTVAEHTRAFIKIQDGCNQFCTYCIIPYARGRIRSRNIGDIVEEISKLAECGYKEVVLTGIHLSSYGKDLKEDISLKDVILAVDEIPGIERIRLGSLEPGIITEEFLENVKKTKKLCPHFHLSLQSGSETVLKRMNRHYTPEEYLSRCQLIREFYDNPAITTDIIVGFPGETQEEFRETKDFAKAVNFAEIHVFKYSMRKGTVAAKMENQVQDQIKAERSEELIKEGHILQKEFLRSMTGKVKSVLIEEEMEENGHKYMTGYTKEYAKVIVDDLSLKRNEIVNVEIKEVIDGKYLLGCVMEK